MVMHRRQELGGKTLLDKRAVDDELGLIRADFAHLPFIDLLLQRLEVALHLIDADTQKISQIQAARVLVEYGGEIAFEHHIVADHGSKLCAGNHYQEEKRETSIWWLR